MAEEAEAIERMRAQYPDAIIVKSATAVGWKDQFSHWWCTDGKCKHFVFYFTEQRHEISFRRLILLVDLPGYTYTRDNTFSCSELLR